MVQKRIKTFSWERYHPRWTSSPPARPLSTSGRQARPSHMAGRPKEYVGPHLVFQKHSASTPFSPHQYDKHKTPSVPRNTPKDLQSTGAPAELAQESLTPTRLPRLPLRCSARPDQL